MKIDLYLSLLFESNIKLLNDKERKQFIDKFRDASPSKVRDKKYDFYGVYDKDE